MAEPDDAEVQLLDEITPEALQRQFDVNILATVAITQACVGGMRKSGWGRIVNISSQAAVVEWLLDRAETKRKDDDRVCRKCGWLPVGLCSLPRA